MKVDTKELISWFFVLLSFSAVLVQADNAGASDDGIDWNEYYSQFQSSGLGYLYTGFKYSGCKREGFQLEALTVDCGDNGILCQDGDTMTLTGRFSSQVFLPVGTNMNIQICKNYGKTCSSSVIAYNSYMCYDFALTQVNCDETDDDGDCYNGENGECPSGGTYEFTKEIPVPMGLLTGFIEEGNKFYIHMTVQSDSVYSNLNCHVQFKAMNPDEFDAESYWQIHNYTRYFSMEKLWKMDDAAMANDYSSAYASIGLVALGLAAFGAERRRRRRTQPALDITNESTADFEMMGGKNNDSVRV